MESIICVLRQGGITLVLFFANSLQVYIIFQLMGLKRMILKQFISKFLLHCLISKAILRSINRKNSFFHRYKLNPTQETKRKYTRYRNTPYKCIANGQKELFC